MVLCACWLFVYPLWRSLFLPLAKGQSLQLFLRQHHHVALLHPALSSWSNGVMGPSSLQWENQEDLTFFPLWLSWHMSPIWAGFNLFLWQKRKPCRHYLMDVLWDPLPMAPHFAKWDKCSCSCLCLNDLGSSPLHRESAHSWDSSGVSNPNAWRTQVGTLNAECVLYLKPSTLRKDLFVMGFIEQMTWWQLPVLTPLMRTWKGTLGYGPSAGRARPHCWQRPHRPAAPHCLGAFRNAESLASPHRVRICT